MACSYFERSQNKCRPNPWLIQRSSRSSSSNCTQFIILNCSSGPCQSPSVSPPFDPSVSATLSVLVPAHLYGIACDRYLCLSCSRSASLSVVEKHRCAPCVWLPSQTYSGYKAFNKIWKSNYHSSKEYNEDHSWVRVIPITVACQPISALTSYTTISRRPFHRPTPSLGNSYKYRLQK